MIGSADLAAIQAVKDALDKAYPPLGPAQKTPPQQQLTEMVSFLEEAVTDLEDEVGQSSAADYEPFTATWLPMRIEGLASRLEFAAIELRRLV